ncbi:hypothetical protein BH11MYX2_BH11MYX2_28560 [soil metagenome]
MTPRLTASLVALTGCYGRRPPPVPMKTPVAIEAINSEYDDVNASDPGIPYRSTLIFSTNRGSKGADFDLWQTALEIARPDGGESRPGPVKAFEPPTPLSPELMTNKNERSPIMLVDKNDWFGERGILAFASDRDGGKGGFDLYATPCIGSGQYYGGCSPSPTLLPLALNTPADEMYLSRPFAPRTVLFASNRDAVMAAGPTHGPNDIYLARWKVPAGPAPTYASSPPSETFLNAPSSILSPPEELHRVDELSSEGDDTAPFVYKTGGTPEVVFVSDRPGGIGQHDLYCSRFTNGAWQAPKILSPFSSAHDELRPIVMDVNGTRYMLFSSNRPGGKGGYDLYAVGYSGCR